MSRTSSRQGKSISQMLATGITLGLFVYFFYHLMHGDRGYFALKGVEEKLKVAEAKYADTLQEREALENRVRMLRPDSLNLDLLDERARQVLGFMKPEEVVILDK